jgi:hypothetical protein
VGVACREKTITTSFDLPCHLLPPSPRTARVLGQVCDTASLGPIVISPMLFAWMECSHGWSRALATLPRLWGRSRKISDDTRSHSCHRTPLERPGKPGEPGTARDAYVPLQDSKALFQTAVFFPSQRVAFWIIQGRSQLVPEPIRTAWGPLRVHR